MEIHKNLLDVVPNNTDIISNTNKILNKDQENIMGYDKILNKYPNHKSALIVKELLFKINSTNNTN